ncbi:hypothetical protein SAMN04487969_15115 [Paenibacillus algorifonticola]|uniref:Subtilase family protein n=1 Tax=Paenibacillus algorifonticola TaxID=684063 RepID=A0A1I2J1I4_9BACL|nr:hypothetical protein SAMN04487969_15115 [Paenibacillus algorifonticola]
MGGISADDNGVGVLGICPDANVRAISIFESGGRANSAAAIIKAANMLRPGDIILIELHRPGPRSNQELSSKKGYLPIEWWPDDFKAIQYATSRGILVVEAGGNGGENLDDPIYNTPDRGFPSDWINPFNRNNRDSGAIVVGAGALPEGTHGRNWGPDRSFLITDRCLTYKHGDVKSQRQVMVTYSRVMMRINSIQINLAVHPALPQFLWECSDVYKGFYVPKTKNY